MTILRRISALTASAVALALAVPSAPAGAAEPGTRPIAALLERDRGFDQRDDDFDIAERTIAFVLAARPDSRLDVVDRGTRRATGFLPTDRAFRRFLDQIGGDGSGSEQSVFRGISSSVPPRVLERALLFHLVIGRTLDADRLRALRGARLRTAEGGTIRVVVRDGSVALADADPDLRDPRVVRADLNAGNKHVAHGVDRVLRFADLPS